MVSTEEPVVNFWILPNARWAEAAGWPKRRAVLRCDAAQVRAQLALWSGQGTAQLKCLLSLISREYPAARPCHE